MRLRIAVVVSLAAILILLLNMGAFAASTCWVNGRLTIHHSCAARTINLWVYVCVNIEEPEYDWVRMDHITLMNNETFSFLVHCGPDCYQPAQIRSGGDVLCSFNLPGRGHTAGLGTIYDPNRCSRTKETDLPPPMP